MKVYLFDPINNEITCFNLQLEAGSTWIDEAHITEFDRTFQGNIKPFLFSDEQNNSRC